MHGKTGSWKKARTRTLQHRATKTLVAVSPFWVFSHRGKQKCSPNSSLCPVLLVFPPLVFVCLVDFSSWCDGSACVWRIHTNHHLVERLGSVDTPCRRGLAVFVVRSRGFSAADCSRLAMLRVFSNGTARMSRCVPLSSVCWVGSSSGSVTWPTYRPTCGRPPSATFGFLKAELSATLHVAMVRRIARLRLGLTAQDEVASAAPTPRGGLGFGGPQAEDVGAGSVSPRAITAEPRLKLSVLLNLALDSELARLPQAKVW